MHLYIPQKWQKLRRNFFVLTLFLWVLIYSIVLSVQVSIELKNQKQIFNDRARSIAELLHQRFIQSETVLNSLETIIHIFDVIPYYGPELYPSPTLTQFSKKSSVFNNDPSSEIEALFKSTEAGLSSIDVGIMPKMNVESGAFDTVLFNRLRGYIKDMIVQHPYISFVAIEPRIEQAEVKQFEEHARSMLATNYKIKSNDMDRSDKKGSAANNVKPSGSPLRVPRTFYYPFTFKEPMDPVDLLQLGTDKYQDAIWREALNRSVYSRKYAIAQQPSDAKNHDFLLLKAIFSTVSPSTDPIIRYTQAAHTISISVNPDKLLSADELPPSNMSVSIYSTNPLIKGDKTRLVIFNPLASSTSSIKWQEFFLKLHFSQNEDHGGTPYSIEANQQIGWEVFNRSTTLLGAVLSLSIALLTAGLIRVWGDKSELSRQTKEIIFQEKERALVTLHSINDAVITMNLTGNIDYANASALEILRTDLDAIKNRLAHKVLNFRYDLANTLTLDPIQTCLVEKRIVELPDNTIFQIHSEDPTLIEGSVSPLCDLKQSIIGAVIVFRDLGPARKKVLAALAASEKRLRQHQTELAHVTRLTTMGEMVSGIAHELNQPLSAILSYNQACIHLLHSPNPNIEKIIQAMQSAATQSTRAGDIIARLRSFIKKENCLPELINVNQHIENVLTLIEHDLRDAEVTLQVDLVDQIPPVLADGIQIEQVILNLIRNAIDAMSDVNVAEKTIRISTKYESNFVFVSVIDKGCGISEGTMDNLFHPFFTTKKDGLGLGLAISTSIIESFGGKLIAKNNTFGGAEFSFYMSSVEQTNATIATIVKTQNELDARDRDG